MITDFVQNCIDGIMGGSGYSLLALGFTLVFGVLKRLNLSYGPSIMLGAYVGTWSFLNIADNIWLVLLTTILATVVIGIYVEQLCFRAVSRETSIASMVSFKPTIFVIRSVCSASSSLNFSCVSSSSDLRN